MRPLWTDCGLRQLLDGRSGDSSSIRLRIAANASGIFRKAAEQYTVISRHCWNVSVRSIRRRHSATPDRVAVSGCREFRTTKGSPGVRTLSCNQRGSRLSAAIPQSNSTEESPSENWTLLKDLQSSSCPLTAWSYSSTWISAVVLSGWPFCTNRPWR